VLHLQGDPGAVVDEVLGIAGGEALSDTAVQGVVFVGGLGDEGTADPELGLDQAVGPVVGVTQVAVGGCECWASLHNMVIRLPTPSPFQRMLITALGVAVQI